MKYGGFVRTGPPAQSTAVVFHRAKVIVCLELIVPNSGDMFSSRTPSFSRDSLILVKPYSREDVR